MPLDNARRRVGVVHRVLSCLIFRWPLSLLWWATSQVWLRRSAQIASVSRSAVHRCVFPAFSIRVGGCNRCGLRYSPSCVGGSCCDYLSDLPASVTGVDDPASQRPPTGIFATVDRRPRRTPAKQVVLSAQHFCRISSREKDCMRPYSPTLSDVTKRASNYV